MGYDTTGQSRWGHLRKFADKAGPAGVLLLFSGCLLLAIWLNMPWTGVAALGFLAVCALLTTIWAPLQAGRGLRLTLTASWIASLVFLASLWGGEQASPVTDTLYAILMWLVALGTATTSLCLPQQSRRKTWQALALVWSLAGGFAWLAQTYLQNDRIGFHLAVLLVLGLLVLCKKSLSLSYVGVLAINTLLLTLTLLPVIDYFMRPSYKLEPRQREIEKLYSYELARRDPEAFAAWWQEYYEEFHQMMAELASSGSKPHTSTLAPGGQATFFDSQIRINNQGFRGADLPAAKKKTYRIVALGESTTFGATLEAGDKPWPELLEEMIRERLKPPRPVQVINAGIPALTLADNLRRLPTEILPLEPDMIISYHGINGFRLLDPAFPRMSAPKAPPYRPRPLKLLADAEHGIKMSRYRRRLAPPVPPPSRGAITPQETDYAHAYQELIQEARTNGVRLVIANFSMAVNEESAPDVIAFYRAGFPSVYWQIQANLLHSQLIQSLGEQHPDIHTVDTHPGLDGEHTKFIDLIHLTQPGRRQLAESMFAGIHELLRQDLRAAEAPAERAGQERQVQSSRVWRAGRWAVGSIEPDHCY